MMNPLLAVHLFATALCLAVVSCESETSSPDSAFVPTCRDEDECPKGSSCTLVALPQEETSGLLEATCLPRASQRALLGHPCERDEDCATQLCKSGRCTELCTSCSPGFSCQPTTLSRSGLSAPFSTCQTALDQPDIELGPLSISASGSSVLALAIPAGVEAFTVVLDHGVSDPDTRVGFVALATPSGRLVLDRGDDLQDLNQGSNPYPGAAALLVPSSDAPEAALEVGTYELRIALFTGDALLPTLVAGQVERVRVFFERRGEAGGELDLNLHLAPSLGIDPTLAADDPWIQELLATLESYYRAQGIFQLGEVSIAALPAEYDVIDTPEQVRDLCLAFSHGGSRGVAVNLFLVGDISFAAGFTSGVPGPHALYGTAASGFAVQRMGNAAQTALVAAHELGHFLGLQHTTRLAGNGEGGYDVLGDDGISDTPVCPEGTNTRDCPDYHNLLFPVFPLDNLSLTAGQAAIVSRVPILAEIVQPRVCGEAEGAVDLTFRGQATGDTSVLLDSSHGSCGGEGSPERWHVLHVPHKGVLSLTVRGIGFGPVVYARSDVCDDTGEELTCAVASPQGVTSVDLGEVGPGAVFIAVDGPSGQSGRFELSVTLLPLEP